MYELQPLRPACRVHFCNWILQSVRDVEIEPNLTSSSDEAWFHLHGGVDSHEQKTVDFIQSGTNTRGSTLHDAKIEVWCGMSTDRIPEYLDRFSSRTPPLFVQQGHPSFMDALREVYGGLDC